MLKVGIPSPGMRVVDIMTADVAFLQSHQTLEEAWQVLHARSISGAPVLTSGRLVGIASKADLADPRPRTGDPTGTMTTVRDVMTRVVYAVRARDSVLTAVKLMIDEDIHRAIVVGEDGTVAGIVTPMDVLRALLHGGNVVGTEGSGAPVEFVDLRELP